MKANKFRSLMINTNKKQQYNVPRHYDYHDHKDDSVYAIIRTSSTNLQMLFQMYLTFNTISILMCIVEILKYRKNFLNFNFLNYISQIINSK